MEAGREVPEATIERDCVVSSFSNNYLDEMVAHCNLENRNVIVGILVTIQPEVMRTDCKCLEDYYSSLSR